MKFVVRIVHRLRDLYALSKSLEGVLQEHEQAVAGRDVSNLILVDGGNVEQQLLRCILCIGL